MEPTIYKPSIYKSPTVYNTGAGGGAWKTFYKTDWKNFNIDNLTDYPLIGNPVQFTHSGETLNLSIENEGLKIENTEESEGLLLADIAVTLKDIARKIKVKHYAKYLSSVDNYGYANTIVSFLTKYYNKKCMTIDGTPYIKNGVNIITSWTAEGKTVNACSKSALTINTDVYMCEVIVDIESNIVSWYINDELLGCSKETDFIYSTYITSSKMSLVVGEFQIDYIE